MTPHQRKKRSLKKYFFFKELVQSLKEAIIRTEEYSAKTNKPFYERLKKIMMSGTEIIVDKSDS